MNPILNEINELYLQVQNYIDPLPEYLTKLTEQERLDYAGMRDESSQIYNLALDKLRGVAPSLSPNEIIEGYTQGCRLLRRSLGGYMCHLFDRAYIPIMIQAIMNEESRTAWMFLQTLADQLGKEVAPLVLRSLDSKSELLREAALSVTGRLELVEAIPKVQVMTKDSDLEISSLAKSILDSLESSI